jgi:hypothetical protein
MSDPKSQEKVEEENQRDIKKTREYRTFRRLLRQVIKAPPIRNKSEQKEKQK